MTSNSDLPSAQKDASPGLKSNASTTEKKVVYKPFDQKLTFICKFCGGKSCKHEDWKSYSGSAIKGLNSDWVTSNILATQRPSTRIMKEYNIIDAFHQNGINAIFNLQEPGEHPFCGDGIHPNSGFSYQPEEFYEHGIYFFNFGWKDMTATSTDVILKILKQMSFSLMNGNKIAIHCHAGRGRTGLIIAAWLIYHHNMTAKEAIKLVRSKRKGAIQSKSQAEILKSLDKEISASRMIFHSTPKFSLEDYIFHQKKLLPLSMESQTRFIPNILIVTLDRLETLVSSKVCTPRDVTLAFSSPNDSLYYKGEWSNAHEKTLKQYKEKINSGSYQVSEIDDPRILAQGLLDFFDNFTVAALKNQFIDAIHSQIHGKEKKMNMKDHFFKQLDKKEFYLVERWVKFFSNLLMEDDEQNINNVRRAVFRICISLVLGRKKFDKLFLKRSLIKDAGDDEQVTFLHVFMLKWIENFNEDFTESYQIVNSPLRISERRVTERMDFNAKRMSAFAQPNSASSESSQSQQELQVNSPPTQKRDSAFKQQAAQDAKTKNGTPEIKSYALTPIQLKSGTDKSWENSPQAQSDGGRMSMLSPDRARAKARMSLLTSSFVKDTPDATQKNYDDFFTKNAFIEEEEKSSAQVTANLDNKEESDENEKFDELMSAIDGLSEKRQEYILEKLLKMRGDKSGEFKKEPISAL